MGKIRQGRKYLKGREGVRGQREHCGELGVSSEIFI